MDWSDEAIVATQRWTTRGTSSSSLSFWLLAATSSNVWILPFLLFTAASFSLWSKLLNATPRLPVTPHSRESWLVPETADPSRLPQPRCPRSTLLDRAQDRWLLLPVSNSLRTVTRHQPLHYWLNHNSLFNIDVMSSKSKVLATCHMSNFFFS